MMRTPTFSSFLSKFVLGNSSARKDVVTEKLHVKTKPQLQNGTEAVSFLCIEKELILNRAEIFLTYTTQRAGEIIGKILKSCAGSNAIFGVAYCGIIYPATSVTNVLFHNSKNLIVIDNSYSEAKITNFCQSSKKTMG